MLDYNRFDISYVINTVNGKMSYSFINHKVAVLCWAKIASIVGTVDVISLDSHSDFMGGFIFTSLSSDKEETFGSKLLPHLTHFSKSATFCSWDLHDDTQNIKIVQNERRYLTYNNDNFIDVAFMKDVINDVHWYYLNKKGSGYNNVECEDINDKMHFYFKKRILEFEVPTKPFILDIDLDFFTVYEDFKLHLISDAEISQYLKQITDLTTMKECVALTIALEPDCCGGIENCRVLCDRFERAGLPTSACRLLKNCTVVGPS